MYVFPRVYVPRTCRTYNAYVCIFFLNRCKATATRNSLRCNDHQSSTSLCLSVSLFLSLSLSLALHSLIFLLSFFRPNKHTCTLSLLFFFSSFVSFFFHFLLCVLHLASIEYASNMIGCSAESEDGGFSGFYLKKYRSSTRYNDSSRFGHFLTSWPEVLGSAAANAYPWVDLGELSGF